MPLYLHDNHSLSAINKHVVFDNCKPHAQLPLTASKTNEINANLQWNILSGACNSGAKWNRLLVHALTKGLGNIGFLTQILINQLDIN